MEGKEEEAEICDNGGNVVDVVQVSFARVEEKTVWDLVGDNEVQVSLPRGTVARCAGDYASNRVNEDDLGTQ